MTLVGFYCPDKEKVELEDCLKKCRLGERCLTLPTLVSISQERKWSGIASTTQLLDGTMLAFLKLTQPYYVDPDSRAFMLQGTKHHHELEQVAKDLGLASEIPMNIDRDIFDLIEFEDDYCVVNKTTSVGITPLDSLKMERCLVLTDYKLWGSFKVAKALGIEEVGKEPDPGGAVYKTTTKYGKAGNPKMIPVFKQVPEKADNWEAELQLNRYRLMLKELGVIIHKMRLQVTVRDGGLYIAYNRGVYKNIYKIPVRLLPDYHVEDYFNFKDICLKKALKDGWDEPCSIQENWEGKRCERYCDVSSYCPKGELMRDKEEKG